MNPKVGQAASLSLQNKEAASLSSSGRDRQAACPTLGSWQSGHAVGVKVGQAASLSLQNKEAASLSLQEENDRQAACPTLPASGYFNPFAAVDTHRRHLPQWRQDGVWYFVTYRLADSLPRSAIKALEAEREQWLAAHPEPRGDAEMKEYWDRFGGRIHDLLDSGSGKCWLRCGDVREIVVASLRFGEGKRYRLDAWVVMPNHVHALVMPINRIDLSKILHTWKSFTANRINRILQRSGKFWQDESYNHIVRNPSAFLKIREYILNNPAKAKLPAGCYKVGQAASLSLSNKEAACLPLQEENNRQDACHTLNNRQAACPTPNYHDRD